MDNEIVPQPAQFNILKDSVVILTGGASGIGAATVRLLNAALAFVVFGDSAQEAAEELIASLDQPENVTFVLTNVSSYESNYALFRSAFEKYGRIDHAISIAGISERENWFDPALTLTDIKKEPDTLTLDVNLKGVLFFARIAMVYLRAGNEKRNRSLTLFSSVAGFRPTPGLAIYQCSKHGVLGLTRALKILRSTAYLNHGIRVNAVCPGMTETNMAKNTVPLFHAANVAVNAPEDVGRLVLAVLSNDTVNGNAVLAIGGRGWDFEHGLDRDISQWLGPIPASMLRASSDLLRESGVWTNK